MNTGSTTRRSFHSSAPASRTASPTTRARAATSEAVRRGAGTGTTGSYPGR